ncbi:unnamed protein product [Closterium sp. NIES-54]
MVQQVLQRFGFTYSSPQSTPLPTSHSLSAPPSDESVEPSGSYPELVGCLMVLRYLSSTSGMGLVLGGRARVVLTGHADASWVDDLATQRSSHGYTFSLGSGSVSWRSTRSSSVLSSSCEAEIYAGAMAAEELRWLTYLLTDLGEAPRSPPVLYVDNTAMLALCQEHRLEHRLEHRTKHIALRYFLARELQQRGQLGLAYVASQANSADVFTKALQPCDHQRFCTVLGLHCPGRAAPASPSCPPATTAARAARATAAAGGAGGATGSAGGAAGAGGAGPATDRHCLSWLLSWFYGYCTAAAAASAEHLLPAQPRDCASQRCIPRCVEAAALGASESAAAVGARESADSLGASASTATDPASSEALHTFTLDAGASHCFFLDCTTVTPLAAPVPVSLADPTGGPVVARASTVLPCLTVPFGSLSGLHLPAFSTNLLSNAVLQDEWVDSFIPGGQRVAICKCSRTGRHLATFTCQPGSGLYTLTTASAQVVESGHPSLLRLRSMHSRLLVSGLPMSLPSLSHPPAPPCLPCVEGRQRAAPHSSEFPPTTAPLQTLHLVVWGPALIGGTDQERYFLLVVDDYTRYTSVFPLRCKAVISIILIPWIRATRRQLRERFRRDFLVLRLHSDRGGEFSSDLVEFCRDEGIRQSFMLLASP